MAHVVQTLLNGVLATNGLLGRHGLGIGATRSLRRHDERQRKVLQTEPALELLDPVVQFASSGGAVEYVRVSTGDNLGQRLAWRLVSDRFGIEAMGDVGQTHTVTERVCPLV